MVQVTMPDGPYARYRGYKTSLQTHDHTSLLLAQRIYEYVIYHLKPYPFPRETLYLLEMKVKMRRVMLLEILHPFETWFPAGMQSVVLLEI